MNDTMGLQISFIIHAVFAFLPDHGCHEIDGNLRSHGLDMEEDMNIIHFYGFEKG